MDAQVLGWSWVGVALSALRTSIVKLSNDKEICKSERGLGKRPTKTYGLGRRARLDPEEIATGIRQAVLTASAQKYLGNEDSLNMVLASSSRDMFFLSTTPFY